MTVARALSQNLKRSSMPDTTKPQPVHRLDYETTGALLVGKTASSIRALNSMFESKMVEKTYYAVTIGDMNEQGSISFDIDDKPSHSDYEVARSVASPRFNRLNLVKLSPGTGRRHQLRIHLSGIGNPILGDKVYGQDGLILYGRSMYLHAHSISFTHPFTKKPITVETELPKKFRKIFYPSEFAKVLPE